MAIAADAKEMAGPTVPTRFRPSTGGYVARGIVAALIAGTILLLPLVTSGTWNERISLAAIFAIIGLSVNIITGHAGQISLGHQAFVGIGAFATAYAVTQLELGFLMGVLAAAVVGALMALVLGLAALRIRGLYLALITLAFGLMAEGTIFNWREFTGGGAGTPAPRPTIFESDRAYAYLAILFLGMVLFIDWRLVRSKAGRAIVALRNNEQVAATLGVNVTGYKLLAFVLGGLVAGLAGALYAHRAEMVQALDFEFRIALIWILMAVVGGLGSRAGVVIGSAFFALFASVVPTLFRQLSPGTQGWFARNLGIDEVTVVILTPLLGALLLILTLTLYPGGIGQQLLPLRRWLAGGPFHEPHRRRKKRRSTPVVGETDGEATPATGDTAEPRSSPTATASGAAGDTAELPRPRRSGKTEGGD